jgi:general stress protein 26
MVGATGFEPAASRSRTERSTRLSHAPTNPYSSVLSDRVHSRVHSAAVKPQAAPLPADLRQLALDTIRDAKFPMLATMDGDQPRVRPVSPCRNDGFTVYVASLRSSHKTGEIAHNHKAELCYLAGGHDQLRITGIVEHVTDRATLEEIWNSYPLLRAFLGSLDNPELVMYRVVPQHVRFMREWALEYHDIAIA